MNIVLYTVIFCPQILIKKVLIRTIPNIKMNVKVIRSIKIQWKNLDSFLEKLHKFDA